MYICRVNRNPKSRFKKVENANYSVTTCKEKVKIVMVNCGGLDIVDGNKKIILGIVSQLMRKYVLFLLSSLSESSGVEITDDQIVHWANQTVVNCSRRGGTPSHMNNFKDKSLSSGIFFLELIAAIEPRAINWEIATVGVTEEDKIMNARYAISSARKIGATVFLTHEDIVEVKSKMLLTFTAALWLVDIRRKNHM